MTITTRGTQKFLPNYLQNQAWYIRGRVNVSLGNYKDAINDLDVSKIMESSLAGKRQIENKARGMNSMSNIPPASFVHSEEPYAMIILKSCRETHYHYCLNELPVEKVPCPSCSIPLYCSQNLLPSEIVLAGRVFIKSIMQRRGSPENANLRENLDLSHHYSQMSPKIKLGLHIYSTVLLYCLQRSSVPEIQINGSSVAQVDADKVLSCLWFQIVIIVSQIRVNSMTIVGIKSIDVHDLVYQYRKSSSRALTSNVEQVRVGQAIYKTRSLFNHSCQPNIHIWQWDCKDRIKFLEEDYFFRYQCCGCSEPNCSGIILDSSVLDSEKHKIKQFVSLTSTNSLENQLNWVIITSKFCNLPLTVFIDSYVANLGFLLFQGYLLFKCDFGDLRKVRENQIHILKGHNLCSSLSSLV
ncbi:hypothetical protein UlMin_024805 [Ulmus minor]